MKKLSLLSISLLMAGNACAMDAEESAQQPHSPRTSFLLSKLDDKSSPGYAVVTQKLLAERLVSLAEYSDNLRSGFIDSDTFRSQVESIKSTMPPYSQVEPLTKYLENFLDKRTLLITVIDAEEKLLRNNLAKSELAFRQAKQELDQACSDAYTNGIVPEAFDTLADTIAAQGATIRQLSQRIDQLEDLRKL